MTAIDNLLITLDKARRTLIGSDRATRPMPHASLEVCLTDADRRASGAFMRINHVGEVCAQALYRAQALSTPNRALRLRFDSAAREETDHLAWTRERLDQLGSRPSRLNPFWFAGAFSIGLVAGRFGDPWSLGFVVETERQVERHLESHLTALPADDHASRAIVRQMAQDERAHAESASAAGAAELPLPVRWAMRLAAKVMTTTARYI